MDFKAIQEILRFVNKSDLTEVELEDGSGFKMKIKRKGEGGVTYVGGGLSLEAQPMTLPPPTHMLVQQQPQAMVGAQPQAVIPGKDTEKNEQTLAANQHIIKSPMIGTFYRSPSPDKPMFVNEGDTIRVGQTLCIIEAMKLFNEIESDVEGKVIKILLDNAKPVEYDQPLMIVELSK